MTTQEYRHQYLNSKSRIGVALSIDRHGWHHLAVNRYDDADKIVETDVARAGIPITVTPSQPQYQTYLKAAMRAAERLCSHNDYGSAFGTAQLVADRAAAEVASSLCLPSPTLPAYTVDLSPGLTSANRINAFGLARLIDHASRGRDAATTILLHGGSVYEEPLELRVCNSGREAFFEWINAAGDPVTDAFDVIHGDPEVQIMWLQRRLAERAAMTAGLSSSDENRNDPAPAM